MLIAMNFHATAEQKLKAGHYRGVLLLDEAENIELPFNFEVTYKGKKPVIIIRNGEEKIIVDEIRIKGDSVNFRMPVFDTEFRTELKSGELHGLWINHYRSTKNRIPFRATYGEEFRFPAEKGIAPGPDTRFEGKWEVTFSPGTADSSKAIGVFHHHEQSDHLTGTFLTETGDYRFLEGTGVNGRLYLSCFDGSHAFLFTAEAGEGGSISKGVFYSGAHFREPWTARKNDAFALRDAEGITKAKSDVPVEFTFQDTEGKMVSLADARFSGHPVILQVMGSWCPNCMDESRYLAELYGKYHKDGLEIIGLAFEKTEDIERSRKQVSRMKKLLGVQYTVLITGLTGKEKAAKALPALEGIIAFPTTVFLDRAHRIVRVHAGFSGPATGEAYRVFTESTEALVKRLIRD
jgi:thiol-disulfide isomerase/thioredoxin